MQTDLAYWIGFNKINGLGPVKLYSIWKYFENLQVAWDAPLDEFKNLEILTNANLKQIQEGRSKIEPEKDLYLMEKRKIGVLTLIDEDYPKNLKAIHDPPAV